MATLQSTRTWMMNMEETSRMMFEQQLVYEEAELVLKCELNVMKRHREHEQKSGFTLPVPTLDEPLEPSRDMISLEKDLQQF